MWLASLGRTWLFVACSFGDYATQWGYENQQYFVGMLMEIPEMVVVGLGYSVRKVMEVSGKGDTLWV